MSNLKVFPTRVGVNRYEDQDYTFPEGFPHPRGGEPVLIGASDSLAAFSPPAWG